MEEVFAAKGNGNSTLCMLGLCFILEFGLPVGWKNSSRPGVKIYLAYNLTGSTT